MSVAARSVLLCALVLSGCARGATYRYRQMVMGVEAQVTIVALDESIAREAGSVAFARLAELEAVMSDYRADSELMRLCATHDVAVPVSDDLLDVLERAEEARIATGGLFDVSVGPLTLLRREARRRGEFPSDAAIATARSHCGGDAIAIDHAAKTVTLRRANMRLDLGGIGKGFAAAKTIATLREHGASQALVAIAGGIAAGDAPPGKLGWRVEVNSRDGAPVVVTLARASISTSGDAEQFFELKGVRYSHVLDPRTGLGATTRIQATVIGPDGAMADALSSALSLLDIKGAMRVMQDVSEYSARVRWAAL